MSRLVETHAAEVRHGARFAFGRNWQRFLNTLNQERITIAEQSLADYLQQKRLDGLSFLDIGSGSGLFSLAARRLGARVVSFDYDPHSVACTAELRCRYFPDDRDWLVLHGSVLDRDFLARLPPADIVYSWGVLHHTGAMATAFANIEPLVAGQAALQPAAGCAALALRARHHCRRRGAQPVGPSSPPRSRRLFAGVDRLPASQRPRHEPLARLDRLDWRLSL